MQDRRLRISYRLSCGTREQAAEVARAIALEQTVELPEACVDERIRSAVVGRIEDLRSESSSTWSAVISYDPETTIDDGAQLLNLLFGNISMKTGIRLARIEWPVRLLDKLGGPRFGIAGIRRLCGVREPRALLCAALKPMGLSAVELAAICHDLAAGGLDVIKDDHGLTDQRGAPFAERVARCAEAIERANARTGGHAVYFPNVTSGPEALPRRLELARGHGCPGVLISPWLAGPETLRWIADRFGLAVLAHPSLAGSYFHPAHGLGPELLLGQIFRLLGSDGVIYPNAGGRFPLSESTCQAINTALRGPLGTLRPALPVPGGGIDVARVAEWRRIYGPDTMFLIGGSLYSQPDLVSACRRLREAVQAASS